MSKWLQLIDYAISFSYIIYKLEWMDKRCLLATGRKMSVIKNLFQRKQAETNIKN